MARVSAFMVMAGLLILAFGGLASAVTPNCDRGGPGPNRMVGTAERDALCGEDGNDTILGRAGNDSLVGGGNNDDISGDEGDDKIKGGTGTDVITGGPGNDVIRPGMFNQTEDGARDKVRCGDGEDIVYVTGRDVVANDCETRRR